MRGITRCMDKGVCIHAQGPLPGHVPIRGKTVPRLCKQDFNRSLKLRSSVLAIV